MNKINDGGPAFPHNEKNDDGSHHWTCPGMTLRDWFAGKALANPTICTGSASEWELKSWFGPNRSNITREEIISKQAYRYADAMLAAREAKP